MSAKNLVVLRYTEPILIINSKSRHCVRIVYFILFLFFTLFGDITICGCEEETEQQLNYLDRDQAVPLFGATIVSMT